MINVSFLAKLSHRSFSQSTFLSERFARSYFALGCYRDSTANRHVPDMIKDFRSGINWYELHVCLVHETIISYLYLITRFLYNILYILYLTLYIILYLTQGLLVKVS